VSYKYELHCHTAEVSQCAAMGAEDVVKNYKEHGYDGIVITDHYSELTFRKHHLFSPQNEVDFYLSGYRKALECAGDDFTVLLGMELRFYLNPNDYLIYGIDEAFIRNNGNLMTYYPKKFSALAKENDLIFLQAHPFRPYVYRCNPKYIDGCEIYNAKGEKDGINEKAEKWAEKNNMQIRMGGADFHRESHIENMSGIITEEPIKTNADLKRILRNKKFTIIK